MKWRLLCLKIVLHSCYINCTHSNYFTKGVLEILPELISNKHGTSVKYIQFYSDFYLPNNVYPFRDNEYIYYPLTVVFKGDKWEVQWIKWQANKLLIGEYTNTECVYCPMGEVTVSLCDKVDDSFEKMICSKRLFFKQEKNNPSPYLASVCFAEVSQFFIDALAVQFGSFFNNILEGAINKEWDIRVKKGLPHPTSPRPDLSPISKFGEKTYMLAWLCSQCAVTVPIAVCWKENVEPSDWVNLEDINFEFLDRVPGNSLDCSIENAIKLAKNRGYRLD